MHTERMRFLFPFQKKKRDSTVYCVFSSIQVIQVANIINILKREVAQILLRWAYIYRLHANAYAIYMYIFQVLFESNLLAVCVIKANACVLDQHLA